MAEQLYGWIFVPLLVVLFVGVNYLKDAWQMIRTTPQASKELNERLLVYHPPLNRTISGEPFNDVNSHLFEALKAGYITLDSDTVKDFVLVTAVSSNRFMQLPALVESVQNFLPNYTLIVYDIGLTATEASLVGCSSLDINSFLVLFHYHCPFSYKMSRLKNGAKLNI